MFQQAFNQLKNNNDERQRVIRYIRDNPYLTHRTESIELSYFRGLRKSAEYVDAYFKIDCMIGYESCVICVRCITSDDDIYIFRDSTIKSDHGNSVVQMWIDYCSLYNKLQYLFDDIMSAMIDYDESIYFDSKNYSKQHMLNVREFVNNYLKSNNINLVPEHDYWHMDYKRVFYESFRYLDIFVPCFRYIESIDTRYMKSDDTFQLKYISQSEYKYACDKYGSRVTDSIVRKFKYQLLKPYDISNYYDADCECECECNYYCDNYCYCDCY